MSVSLESWEGVTNTVERYFCRSMTPYYTARYIEIAAEIIGSLLGKPSFTYVETCVSLPEPIWQKNNTIFFSVPMMSLYINQPVELPQNTVKYVNRFDIFDRIEVYDNKNYSHGSDNSGLSGIRKHTKRARKKLKPDDGYAGFTVNWSNVSVSGQNPDELGLNESDTTVLVQLFRLVIMISHWYQHVLLHTSYKDHIQFQEIEMADVDLYNKLIGERNSKTEFSDYNHACGGDDSSTSSSSDSES